MQRIKILVESSDNRQFTIRNISGDFIALLSDNGDGRFLFCGDQFFKLVTEDKKSTFWITGTYDYCIEKINMLVEKYINRFFEKE
jgi:hypothetical protein